MKTILLSLFMAIAIASTAQSKSENDWAEIYRPQEWKAANYIQLMEFIKFKPVGELKGATTDQLKTIFLKLDDDDIKQTNITASFYCSVKHEESYLLWNLQYPKISKEAWDTYCKGLVTLMYLDGTLKK